MRLFLSALLLAATANAEIVNVYLATGQSNANTAWAQGISSTFEKLSGSDRVKVVNIWHSGSPMWMWSSGGNRGNHYNDDLAAVRARMASIAATGDTPLFSGILWMQGESDIDQSAGHSFYVAAFNNMLQFYKQDLELAKVPNFTLGVVDVNPSPAYGSSYNSVNLEALRQIQRDLGEMENGSSVDSRGYARYDLFHLDTVAASSFGSAMALEFANNFGVFEQESMPSVRRTADGKLEFKMMWSSEAGASYRFQHSSSPAGPWEDLGDLKIGTGKALLLSEESETSTRFYRMNEVAGPPRMRRVATVGDSITAEASQVLQGGGTFYWPGCWPAHLRTLLDHRVAYSRNTLTGRFTFATEGARTGDYLPGGIFRSTWDGAIASDADTIMIMVGANDLVRSDTSAETTTANILTLWDEAIAAGKQVIGLEIPGVRADHGSAFSFRTKQLAVNSDLKKGAARRHMPFIECAKVLDDDGDGWSDPKYIADVVHPGILGGMKLADFIAPKLQARLYPDTVRPIPPEGSPVWVTGFSFPSGQPGENRTATGWNIQAVGNAALIGSLVPRTDGIPGHWQELRISGMTDAGCLKQSPTDYVQLYTSNWNPSFSPGDRLVMVAEVDLSEPFWMVWSEMNIGGLKSGVYPPNGALTGLKEKPAAYRGLLVTEPWTYTSGSPALAILKICGNGTIRIGRLGIFKEAE